MSKFFVVLTTLLLSLQKASAMNIDKFIDEKVAPVSDFIADIIFFQINIFGMKAPLIIFWILIAGIFFTIYFIS